MDKSGAANNIDQMNNPPEVEDTRTPKERHSLAMDLSERADRCKAPEEASRLYAEALNLEQGIASNIPADKENEPSRSIIYRSAASIALNLSKIDGLKEWFVLARELALEGLSGYPPSCVAQELFDVYKNAIIEKREEA